MSRPAAEVLTELMDLFPPSALWTRDPDSITGLMMLPDATEWSAFEAAAEAMLPECDPRQAIRLLPDYERVLGPDPCGRDLPTLTIAQQQALVYQRWTARGGQSIAYFQSLAAALGVQITIIETVPFVCGDECGGELAVDPEQFVWTVQLPQTELEYFECGGGVAGDYLSTFTPNPAVCPIANSAPAQTVPVFDYVTGS